jgi:hypothetical protein
VEVLAFGALGAFFTSLKLALNIFLKLSKESFDLCNNRR